MRKLATVLCLLVLCFASASAQSWNLAYDAKATLMGQTLVTYDVVDTRPVLEVRGETVDELILWRTGDGVVSQTISTVTQPGIQGHAAVLNGIAMGLIA